MSLIRFQPRTLTPANGGHETQKLGTDLDRLFDSFFAGPGAVPTQLIPAIELLEESDRYVVRAELAGLTPNDVQISYQDGLLTIQGEKKTETQETLGKVQHQERFFGKFSRTVRVPRKVAGDKIEASFEHGVLEIQLPFNPEAQPRKIDIRAK